MVGKNEPIFIGTYIYKRMILLTQSNYFEKHFQSKILISEIDGIFVSFIYSHA